MSMPDFTPLDRERFKDIIWLHQAGDRILAETHADSAIAADSDEDCDFHVDMAYLYALRATYLGALARAAEH